MDPPRAPTVIARLLRWLGHVLNFIQLLYDFIENDFLTFAVPNTAFGLFSVFATSALVECPFASPPSAAQVLKRVPGILVYNIANLLVFDLANQRSPNSVAEDRINKPWRPIPRGKITTEQTRRLILATIPIVLLINYVLGVWRQGVFILLLTWLYNDLRGGDEAFLREFIIAVAYGLFNSGSLKVAAGPGSVLTHLGVVWTVVVSGVILTTMQVQDLKDKEGDRTRGRKTIVLFLGEEFSRASIALFICFWSCLCIYFWALGALAIATNGAVSLLLALRVFYVRSSSREDARTWRLWCAWHASLYTMPLWKLVF
ncbi:hypothetical protein MGN70_004422 [Eutypa lata]|uniref:Putative digeranylgeranylglyceryl phosphate synthase protein n=1 Tax=Eutypa lata (strain UCR-EL1) TaxID=1287681 RepID=M7TLU3_EUTLA|nr:putative digeranylgeranylglyceryl phosphate synthase protein [Eutypa lata UCREL1]KAI1254026.1 hypothetical protein MGN70_004422 [Eutypa lata]